MSKGVKIMTSIFINIVLSVLIIFLIHKGFEYIKNRFTEEETQYIGEYQSKKYDELIKELQDIKQDNVITDIQPKINMENELSEFMNEL